MTLLETKIAGKIDQPLMTETTNKTKDAIALPITKKTICLVVVIRVENMIEERVTMTHLIALVIVGILLGIITLRIENATIPIAILSKRSLVDRREANWRLPISFFFLPVYTFLPEYRGRIITENSCFPMRDVEG
jgi:hypothetical protein